MRAATTAVTRAAAIALLATGGVSGCTEEEGSAGPELGADVEDVAEPPGGDEEPFEQGEGEERSALVGQTVTVSGEVTEVLAQGALRVGGEDGAESVVVLSAPYESFAPLGLDDPQRLVDTDTVVQVTGTVRQLLLEPFQEEFGIEYDTETFAPLEGANVLVADAVSTLAGDQLTLAGEVEEVLGRTSFRLEGSGWNVVVLDAGNTAVDPGDVVQVQGTVRRLDAGEDAYEGYEGELVLVADTVSPFTLLES